MSYDDWKTTEPDFYDPNREELDPEEAGVRHLCKICMCAYDCLDPLVPEDCCACTCPLQCVDEFEENELLNLMAENDDNRTHRPS